MALLPLDAAGWSNPGSLAAANRVIYVSYSGGNDANDGSTSALAVKTIAQAKTLLTSGQNDWILLKRGDVWPETLGRWTHPGKALSAMMVVSSYGDTSAGRPLMHSDANGLTTFGSPEGYIHSVAFFNLEFKTSSISGDAAYWKGVDFVYTMSSILIEDCWFHGYYQNIVIVGNEGTMYNINVRRCQATYAQTSGTNHANNLYFHAVSGLQIEENLIHHGGWNELVPICSGTIFRHNVYVQDTCSAVTVDGNIISYGGSHGLQLRPGGTCTNNFFFRNSINMLMGSSIFTVSNNVVMGGKNITDALPRGWGLEVNACSSGMVTGNVFTQMDASSVTGNQENAGFPVAMVLGDGTVSNVTNNLIVSSNYFYNYGTGNVIFQADGTGANLSTINFSNNYLYDKNIAESFFATIGTVAQSKLTLRNNVLYSPSFDQSTTSATFGTGNKYHNFSFGSPGRSLLRYIREVIGLNLSENTWLNSIALLDRYSYSRKNTAKGINSWVRAGYRVRNVAASSTQGNPRGL